MQPSVVQQPIPKGLKPGLIGGGSALTLASLVIYTRDCESGYTAVVIGLFVFGLSLVAMGFALQKPLRKVLLVFGLTALSGFALGLAAMMLSLHVVCAV